MNDLVVFEVGMQNDEGKYYKLMETRNHEKVQEYIEMSKQTMPDNFELVFLEKTYRLICTTPHIVGV